MAAHKVYHPSRAPPRQEKSRNGSARQERSRATAMPRKPLYPPKPILGQMARQKVCQPQRSRLAGAAAVKQAQKLTERHAFSQMASGRHASGTGRLDEDDLGGPELCERCATIGRPQQREPVASLCQARLLRKGSDASSTLAWAMLLLVRAWAPVGCDGSTGSRSAKWCSRKRRAGISVQEKHLRNDGQAVLGRGAVCARQRLDARVR
jgi:hypothetical protein